MVKKGRRNSRYINKHGQRISKNNKNLGVSAYAPDDLPDSVKAVLKVLYPQSKYTRENL